MKLREVRFRDAVLIPGEHRHDTLVRSDRFKGTMVADLESREVVLVAGGEEVRVPFDNTVYRAGEYEAPRSSIPVAASFAQHQQEMAAASAKGRKGKP